MKQQDEAEFSSFAAAQWPRLYRTAFLLTGDHQLAEDLAQATLTKVYLSWPRIMRMDHPAAYARTIMTNQATSWWRRRSTSELPPSSTGISWRPGSMTPWPSPHRCGTRCWRFPRASVRSSCSATTRT